MIRLHLNFFKMQLGFPRIFLVLATFLISSTSTAKILALGDSLTFGYEVDDKDTWPTLLAQKLNKTIVNGGTSGATTAFGIPTLKFHLKRYKPSLVLYALGANDALRGIAPKTTEKNIREALNLLKKEKIPVILLGMKAPPNYGEKFPKEFSAIFPRLAKEFDILLYPFLLEGVAGEKSLNQPDGMHPNEAGYKIISENIYQFMKKTYESKPHTKNN